MCCIVSPRLHGINEKYALLAVSGCFSHVLFCVSLPLVVLFLLLGFSGFHWFHLSLLLSAVYPHSAFSSFLFSVHSLFLLCSSHMFPSSRLCFLCYFDLFLVYFCIFFYSFGKKAKPYFKIEFLHFPSLTRGAWPIQCGPQKRNIYFNFLIKCAPIAIVGITASLYRSANPWKC